MFMCAVWEQVNNLKMYLMNEGIWLVPIKNIFRQLSCCLFSNHRILVANELQFDILVHWDSVHLSDWKTVFIVH